MLVPPPAPRFPRILMYSLIILTCPSWLQYKLYRCPDRHSRTRRGMNGSMVDIVRAAGRLSPCSVLTGQLCDGGRGIYIGLESTSGTRYLLGVAGTVDTRAAQRTTVSLTSDSSEVCIFIRTLSISRSLCPIRGLLGPDTWPMWSSPR